MHTSTIVELVVLIVIYLLISELYLKRYLGILSNYKWLFNKHRNKFAILIDILIIVLFIVSNLILFEAGLHKYSAIVRTSPMFGLFFLQKINHGIEEFLTNRSEKFYYHEWLASIVLVVAFLILFVEDLG